MGHTIMTETQTIPAFAVWGIGLAATVLHIGATGRADGRCNDAHLKFEASSKIVQGSRAMEPSETAEVEMRL
jgi:hypothetical protein